MNMAIPFNTLNYVEKLKSAGTPVAQAVANAEALIVALGEWANGTLATKEDLAKLELGMGDMKVNIADMKVDMANMKVDMANMKVDMADMKSELKGDIRKLDLGLADAKSELKLEIADVRSDVRVIKWMLATVIACNISLVTKAFF